jgi:hypothetical protein
MRSGGCLGAPSLPGTQESSGRYSSTRVSGGTLVVEDTEDNTVPVSVETKSTRDDASVETEVAAGTAVVRREFLTANRGDRGKVVTPVARFGSTSIMLLMSFRREYLSELATERGLLLLVACIGVN